MEKIEIIRELLIRRYSKLKYISVEKAKSNFENMTIEVLIEKHNSSITFSYVLVALIALALTFQLITLYFSKTIPIALVTNILVLIIFFKGLRDNYEIKEVLNMLKVIDKE
jgi:hypothetical protein